jgi:hypothetical protein
MALMEWDEVEGEEMKSSLIIRFESAGIRGLERMERIIVRTLSIVIDVLSCTKDSSTQELK